MMSIATEGQRQLELVERVLDEGLPFVASYLKRVLNRPVIITDSSGRIHYPEVEAGRTEEAFVEIPSGIGVNEFYYRQGDGCLFYHIGSNGASAFVIVRDLPPEVVARTASVLKGARLAVKCCFASFHKFAKSGERFERELREYFLQKNASDVREIFMSSGKDLNINIPYTAAVMEAEEAEGGIDWGLVGSYSREYLKKTGSDVIPVALPAGLVFVVPNPYADGIFERGVNWPGSVGRSRCKEFIEKTFSMKTSIGIGQPYPLSDLYKSYQEACLTLILLRVMGKKGFVREFSELGVFSFLFSQGLSSVKSFCLKTLGPLIEDDGNSTAVLLPTLRSLVDHGFNRSAAAKSLYVHINTLHYRLSKIEKLINADLSQPDVRANLYIAVKAWDALCQWRRKRGFFAPETV